MTDTEKLKALEGALARLSQRVDQQETKIRALTERLQHGNLVKLIREAQMRAG